MAALLRQGARRIGGSVLQRTQAALTSPAAADERRRLLVPRRKYSTQELEQAMREIQKKKNELYDAIKNVDQKFGKRTFQNIRLQQYLSPQVCPRPWDREWRSLRFSRRVASTVEMAGVIALGSLGGYATRQYRKCLAARDALWAAVREEEEQEARAAAAAN